MSVNAFELGRDSKDDVVLILADGRTLRVRWNTDLSTIPRRPGHVFGIDKALLPRMPVTLLEQAWVWEALAHALVPGGGVRFVGPSLHA